MLDLNQTGFTGQRGSTLKSWFKTFSWTSFKTSLAGIAVAVAVAFAGPVKATNAEHKSESPEIFHASSGAGPPSLPLRGSKAADRGRAHQDKPAILNQWTNRQIVEFLERLEGEVAALIGF